MGFKFLDDAVKDLVKKLFSNIFSNDHEKKEINEEIENELKTNAQLKIEYDELLKQKKEVLDKIKEFKLKNPKIFDLQKQADVLTEDNKIIKADLMMKLECKANIVGDLYRYYKKKFAGKKTNDLFEVAGIYTEVFGDEEYKGE